MPDLLQILLILLVVLTMVTLVGHGIWAFLAFLFGASRTEITPLVAADHCPRCGGRLTVGRCLVCDWPLATAGRDRTLAILGQIRGQLEKLDRLGLIDRTTCQRLLETLETERQRCASPKVAEPVVTAELVAEPAVDELELVDTPVASSMVSSPPTKPPPATVAPPPEAAPQHRDLGGLLAAFLEEKNIRWGELIGGMLIVCCSIALVISFWAKIAERPFLKFFVFNGVTAGLFGLGLYAAYRWKLRTTSHGVLVIATLLVPLNFLAIAAFSRIGEENPALTIAGELVSIGLFTGLCYLAGRIVTPSGAWLLTIGTMIAAAAQLLFRRWIIPPASGDLLLALGAIPVVACATVNGLRLFSWRRLRGDGEQQATELLTLLGTSLFATLLSLGLLLTKSGDPEGSLHKIAVLVSAVGVAPLAVGLFLWMRGSGREAAGWFKTATVVIGDLISPNDSQQMSVTVAERRPLVGLSMTGLSIAVGGAAALVAGVVLAWPIPATMYMTAIFVAAALTLIALAFDLSEGLIPAAACFALAYLVGWHAAAGRLAWHGNDAAKAAAVLVSGASGQALAQVAALLAATVAMARWFRRSADGKALAMATAGVATASVALLGRFGLGVRGDPLGVTWFFAGYAVAAFIMADLTRRRAMVWIGSALAFASCAQGIVFVAAEHWPLAMPWLTTLECHAAAMVLLAVACAIWGRAARRERFGPPLLQAAIVMSAISFARLAAASVAFPTSIASDILTVHWLALAAIWLGLALVFVEPLLFAAFQIALTAATWFGVGIWLARQEWFREARWGWLDPWGASGRGDCAGRLEHDVDRAALDRARPECNRISSA